MRKRGRPVGSYKLTTAQQRWLADHWTDDSLTDADMAAHLKVSIAGMYNYKPRLGLGLRPARLSEPARVARRVAALRQANRLAKIQARPRTEPEASTWRCRCGGRSTDRDGHPACLAA